MIVCPQCGKLNPENFNYCLECGAELNPEASHSAESQFFMDLSTNSPEVDEIESDEKGGDTEQSEGRTPSSNEDAPPVVGQGVLELSPDDLVDSDSELPPPAPPIAEEPKEPEMVIESTPVFKPEIKEEKPQEFICAGCKAQLSPDDNFCNKCGTPVKKDASASTTDSSASSAEEEDTQGKTVFMQQALVEEPQNEIVARLKLVDPAGQQTQTFELKPQPNILGKTDGDIIVDEASIANRHCAFSYENGRMTVEDNGTKNGVFLRVRREVVLQSGQYFRLGQQLFRFIAPNDFKPHPAYQQKEDTLFLGSPSETIWGVLERIGANGIPVDSYYLDRPVFKLGRSTGDVSFSDDQFMSSAHAELSQTEEGALLKDLGSSNGSFLRIQKQTLESRDTLMIGRKIFLFDYA